MTYHRPNPGRLGESYGVPGDAPRLIAPVLGDGCGPGTRHLGGFSLGADDANKSALKAAKAKAFKDKIGADVVRARQVAGSVTFSKPSSVTVTNGKVDVPTSSFWGTWNQSAAQIVQPFAGLIDALPIAAATRSKMKSRPLDALIDIFDPVEDAVGRAVDKVIQQKGPVQNFFGKNMNVARVQPVDTKADASTRNIMKTLRTIQAFYVLSFTQPVEFAAALLSEGVNLVGDVARAAADVAQTLAERAGAAAAQALEAAGDAADAVSAFFGLGGFALGDGGASAAATVAGSTVAAAPVEVSVLDAVLAALAGVLAGALDTAIGTGAKLVGDMITGEFGKPATTSSQGVKIAPKLITGTALSQGRASGAFQVQTEGGLTNTGQAPSGVSPVVIVGGLAAVVVLGLALSKRR